MPKKPVKKPKQPAKKNEKIAVDKTFGMKNKKGKKAAAMMKSSQTPQTTFKQKQIELEKKKEADRAKQRTLDRIEKEKIELEKREKELEQRRLEAESKANTLCELFVKGDCEKGSSCEFLHDWTKVDRAEKIDLYSDPRQGTENFPSEKSMLCYHFLDAVKRKKYGYFWVCPNKGVKCQYKHYLPSGYVLDRKNGADDKDEQETIEDEIDFSRNSLIEQNKNQTEVTFELFTEWLRKLSIEETTKKDISNKKTGKEFFLSAGNDESEENGSPSSKQPLSDKTFLFDKKVDKSLFDDSIDSDVDFEQ